MERNKKVLFMITKGNFGGAQRYVFDLATSLPKQGFDVVVACGPGETLKDLLNKNGIKVIDILSSQRDISIKKDLGLFIEVKNIIQNEKPDILHLNSSKIGAVGAIIGRICKVPKIIFTGHGWASNEDRNIFSKTLFFVIHYITILCSHVTIVVSKKLQKDIGWMPFISSKIKVVNNGIAPFKTLTKKTAKAELLINGTEADAKKTVIVSISELTNNKGIDIALKGIAALSKDERGAVLYRICGKGEEHERLQSLTRELGIEAQVKFLGFVNNAKGVLSAADIFLLPSRTEAFPYVILEAGYAGAPIISACVGGIPEVITDMKNGILVHPKNPKEIAEAISYLLRHKDKQRLFGSEIKKTITDNFTLDRMVSNTVSVYLS